MDINKWVLIWKLLISLLFFSSHTAKISKYSWVLTANNCYSLPNSICRATVNAVCRVIIKVRWVKFYYFLPSILGDMSSYNSKYSEVNKVKNMTKVSIDNQIYVFDGDCSLDPLRYQWWTIIVKASWYRFCKIIC